MADGFNHCVFQLNKPDFYAATSLHRIHKLLQRNEFFLTGNDRSNLFVLSKLAFTDAFKSFLEMRLHLSWIFRLGQDFEKIVI